MYVFLSNVGNFPATNEIKLRTEQIFKREFDADVIIYQNDDLQRYYPKIRFELHNHIHENMRTISAREKNQKWTINARLRYCRLVSML